MSWLAEVVEALNEVTTTLSKIRLAAELLGLNPSEINDPSIKCLAILRRGLTPDICKDFREIRRWVMCRAWDLLETKQAETFREAVRRAWEEAHLGCAGVV